VAYDGAFKSFVTDVIVKENYDSGVKEVKFAIVVLTEPKYGEYQYKNAGLVSAKDDQGKACRQANQNSGMSWQSSRKGIVSLSDYSSITLTGLGKGNNAISELVFNLPVRVVTETKERKFQDALNAEKPIVVKDDSCEMTLSACSFTGGTCSAKILIKGDKDNFGWNSNEFSLEQNGAKLGVLNPNSSSTVKGGISFELRNFNSIKVNPGEKLDIVVKSPSKSVSMKLKFTFRDLALPK